MKNITVIIFTFLVTVGVVGNAFANPTDESRFFKNSNRTWVDRNGDSIPVGGIYYSKQGGVTTKTITGVVIKVNTEKNVFVVEDKHDMITTPVLTDSRTIASLQVGQLVTVKLRSGSPLTQSVL